MNCQDCGAPPKLLESRDCLVGEHCTAFCFPRTISPDGVAANAPGRGHGMGWGELLTHKDRDDDVWDD